MKDKMSVSSKKDIATLEVKSRFAAIPRIRESAPAVEM